MIPPPGIREAFLKALVLCGAACVLLTEVLSLLHALTRAGVALGWTAVIVAALLRSPRRIALPTEPRSKGAVIFYLTSIAAILAITGFTALVSAPNSADAMAYHLPRVVYWIQARSVAFFPTPYLNQIMLQPFAEYAMAHTYLLSGGDRFVNLVQFTGFVGSIVGVSLIAQMLGLDSKGQAIAALVCATLPNAILQASGAKNDCLATLWLVAAVLFAGRRQTIFLALALGLALGTKATAYLFAPPILFAVWLIFRPRITWSFAATIAAGVLLLNAPQYARNYQLSGSVLGFDSSFGDGQLPWRNQTLGWKPVVSNALRNFSEQLGSRSEAWNIGVYDAVLRIHRTLHLDPQDPADTFRGSVYAPPKNANHEADANNRWHLLLLVIAVAVMSFRRDRFWQEKKSWLIYTGGLAGAFLAFCLYLRWQPFFSRLELPLFVLASPVIASLLVSLRPAVLQIVVCLFLLDGTRHPLLDNWTRPLRGPNSILHEARDLQYFNDLSQFGNHDFYFSAAAAFPAACDFAGIDINRNQLEYPLQVLLREKNPRIRFVHVDVNNPSRRYLPATDSQPCQVIRLR